MVTTTSRIVRVPVLLTGMWLLWQARRRSIPRWLRSWWLPQGTAARYVVDTCLCAVSGSSLAVIGALIALGLLPYNRT
jgi:hypothetical protein